MSDIDVAANLSYRMVALREAGRFTADQLERFTRFVLDAPDEALFRVNPLIFAEEHALSGRDAIDLFIHATRAGIFDFSWGVLCHDCGAFITTKGGLRSLGRTQCKL